VTAEIAILNKSAIAIAADSAVTISAGDSQEKIFDSADKLFELSDHDPIGIMIYNSMDFMGTPLGVLVKDFRVNCISFSSVRDAGEAFLAYLQKEGEAAPASIKRAALVSVIRPQLEFFVQEATDKFLAQLRKGENLGDPAGFFDDTVSESLADAIKRLEGRQAASFIGKAPSKIRLDKASKELVGQLSAELLPSVSEGILNLIEKYVTLSIRQNIFSEGKTGIVVFGFGSEERFPSLVWYETDGLLCGHLKYRESALIDIDRQGRRAAVLPFAQKDMIERFLYGLDEGIEHGIKQFCKQSVPEIADSLLERVEFENEGAEGDLRNQARNAEQVFLNELDQSALEKIRQSSRTEIEDMVEFMPKPEMAKMAEALIDLTSIKRRVTRGMETVGGPVDVAVISRSEGFVWVKRKHYFPAELNQRFYQRMQKHIQSKSNGMMETENDEK